MRARRPIWLDLTRLASRVGRGPFTGIDRVEHAYLAGLLARGCDLAGFVRTATGYVVLDREGCAGFLDRMEGRIPWGAPDALSGLCRGLTPARRAAEADLRRLATISCLRPGLDRLLRRTLPPGTPVLNVGHSNLSETVLGALVRNGARPVVMLHDAIPLDLPHLHRPGTPASFASRLEAVARHAALVLFPSQDSAGRVRRLLVAQPQITVVTPGVVMSRPDPVALHERLVPEPPYFVAVGTIDGRKNQAFLLDLWSAIGPNAPRLYLAGSRGWCDEALSRRLDAPPKGVVEVSGLADEALAALVEASAALLHPSLAEGFGFPLIEAALRDVPVVAGELPVYAETLGDIGIYLPHHDLYQWVAVVKRLSEANRRGEQARGRRPDRPTWDAHLDFVLDKL